jgi:hypothetical protein
MAGFFGARAYGFEIVDAMPAAWQMPWRINGTEFLARPESIDFFEKAPRIKLNAITCDLSRDGSAAPIASFNRNGTQADGTKDHRGRDNVFPAAHGFLARAGARAVAEGQDA